MEANKMQTPAQRGEPLKVSELVPGEYYEDILTEQRVLLVGFRDTENMVVKSENGVYVNKCAVGRYYNKVTGLYTDFQVPDNQLRKWK